MIDKLNSLLLTTPFNSLFYQLIYDETMSYQEILNKVIYNLGKPISLLKFPENLNIDYFLTYDYRIYLNEAKF